MKLSLFSKKQWVQTSNSLTITELPAKPWPQKADWILSRSLCLYRLLPIKNIPPRDRKNALTIRLRQISPWPTPGSYIVCQGDYAQVWLWDEAARSAKAAEHNAGKSRPIPESLLQEKPQKDGAFLRQCSDGVELQYWRHKTLLFSQWWQQPPSTQKLRWTLQANDLFLPQQELTPLSASLLSRPWAPSSTGNFAAIASSGKIMEKLAWLILLFAASAFLAWFAIQHLQLEKTLTQEQKKARSLRSSLETTLQGRGKMAEDLLYVNNALALQSTPTVTLLFAKALELIATQNTQLTSWNYRNQTLALELEGKKSTAGKSSVPDESAIISAFEKDPLFHNVSATAGKSESTINLTIAIPARLPQATKGKKEKTEAHR